VAPTAKVPPAKVPQEKLQAIKVPSDAKKRVEAELEEIQARVANAKKQVGKLQTVEFVEKGPVKGKVFTLDLRIHTPASKGYFSTGGIDTADALLRLAKVKKVDLLAITDFYSVNSVAAVQKLAKKSAVKILPGFDLRIVHNNCNEIYLTALFPEDTQPAELEKVLRELQVPAYVIGDGEFILKTPLKKIIHTVEEKGGVIIPSHLDKTPYRQAAIKDFIENYGFHAFDLVHPANTDYFQSRWPSGKFTFFTFSSANSLAQVGSRACDIKMKDASFESLKERVARRV
jgi:PHP family Zn ribbon phosphoesterase